ncbi:MAG TPA: uroporphyrinogen decarboxylase family protein [Candidatus Hydrogenedentes bacterium]|nr:uroporphyrinogen decarboxylase family protein [Candidatus Hydrogenedentota bacterium]HOS03097.1 uroporphyrinogen decarboxylase family protein [Candidatus Hydrogenedentota bacterium]
MTPRERFIAALERKPFAGRVPHFELVFYLTMEAFGKVHPSQRNYAQWDQMSESERNLHRNEIADIFIMTAERYEHNAIFLHPNPGSEEETLRLIDLVREKSGDAYFLMIHGDATYGIPDGAHMADFTLWLYEHLDEAKEQAQRQVDGALAWAERLAEHGGLDGFALCSDYCLNTNPFLGPEMFAEVVAPYLAQLIAGQRELGFYVIKHTDGNIMPIIDQIVAAKPHALHSIDPQAGVDIAEVKRLYGDRVCLIGNVNCGLLQSGTDEEVVESARYCIRHGMPGGGYIFSTSNCAYTGLALDRYELMWKVWREEAIYA